MGDFNARLGQRKEGEEAILGTHCFGKEAVHAVESPNRDLFMEFCVDRELVVANTLKSAPAEKKATYVEPGISKMSEVREGTHNMLDLIVCDRLKLEAYRT